MKKGLLGVAILVLGVIAGLILLKRSQEFREKAAYDQEPTYTICHQTGSGNGKWEEIEVVGAESLKNYLSAGDKLGGCDLWQVSSVSLTIAPTLSDNERLGDVNFQIKFQLVDRKRPNQKVKIVLVPKAGKSLVFDKVTVRSDESGKYSGSLSNVKPAVYDVLVKGASHLQRKFENEMIQGGGEIKDWSQKPLLAGDFNSDNLLDISDVADLLSFYEGEKNITDKESSLYDVNFDGLVDSLDVDVVVENYNNLEVRGEQ